MILQIQLSKLQKKSTITITGSKSETNRLLLLRALFPEIQLKNASNSEDSEVMMKALQDVQPTATETLFVDVHHAGTAMRFLTAFFASQEGKEIILTGSSRMKERPIKILVDALLQMGVEITYTENEGYPPLRIRGKKLMNQKVSLPANVSSQYISALLLIAPKLENGLELKLEGEITSLPYIKMTLDLLNKVGVETYFENNSITIQPSNQGLNPITIRVESDWSSVSYWYSILALSEIGTQITLSSFKENSLQGDAVLKEIYKDFGVQTIFNDNQSITLSKYNATNLESVTYNLQSSPDIAQTIAVTCFGLGIGCLLTGLHTLKIKETDRLQALKNELEKLGATVEITNESLKLEPCNIFHKQVVIHTYQDHRMAMAFAPLALKMPLTIEDAGVVTKSYPDFWKDLQSVGFDIKYK